MQKIHKVYDVLDNEEQKFITLWWVLSEKDINDKLNVKARLATRGFQEDNEHVLCDSPTCNKQSMCSILNIIASLKLVPTIFY